MALLNDILSWTETSLTPWQSDAVRRLFQKPEGLSEQDYEELFLLLKAAHGLPNPQNLQPTPLAGTHVPATTSDTALVILKKMTNLQNVNRINPGQSLNFSPIGMTIIYGGNASGKSGFVRVLKRACRARDQSENVLPDATDPNAQGCIPEATFEVIIGGNEKPLKWSNKTVSPDELSVIAVFDTHCARTYLTSEQDIAYLPYGLDVVENLANKVIPELSRRLDQEILCTNVDAQPFSHLLGETVVGRLVATLNDKTEPSKVLELSTLTQKQTDRILELDKVLAESDPRARANELRISGVRIKQLANKSQDPLVWVDDKAIERLKSLNEAYETAAMNEKTAAEHLRSEDVLLPGTGEPVWKALFDAARKFSTEVAYKECAFPHTGKGALCPLCQQSVEPVAGRLKRFEKFVKEDTAKVADEKRRLLNIAISKIDGANLSINLDNALINELDSLDKELSGITAEFEKAINERRKWMLGAVKSHDWNNAPILSKNPRQLLRNLAASVKGIVALIECMKLRSLLTSCKMDLKTKPISDKSKALASSAVTGALKTALEQEFDALGIGHIKTKLNQRNDKGKMMYRLLLDLPSSMKIEEILSEGEQRAIALGSFFAELKLSGHLGGIVLDDPVSSLDHHWRQNVANRLAEEALKRQVIIFTHDTVFLGDIRDAIKERNVPNTFQYLEWFNGHPGHASDGLPWDHKSYMERIDELEKAQKTLEKKPWPAYPNETEKAEMREQYSLMRATIERVIEDVVFNGVVQRYRDWIRVDHLEDTIGCEKDEYTRIKQLHKRCNDITEAHDPASLKSKVVPTAKQFGQDLLELNAVIKAIKDRRKKIKKAIDTP